MDSLTEADKIAKTEGSNLLFPKTPSGVVPNAMHYHNLNLMEYDHELYATIQERLRNVFNSSRQTLLQIDSIDFESCTAIQDSSETIYACLIKTDVDSAFYNLIIEDSSGVAIGPYVLEYVMDSAFNVGFSAGNVDMSSFEGKVAKYTLDALFTPFTSEPDSRDCTHEECWKLIFGGYGSGSGIGSSSGDLSPGSGVFIPPPNQTVSGIAQHWCFYTLPVLDETGNWYNVTFIEPCEDSPLYPFTGSGDGSSFCDEEECLRFFPDLGFPVRDPIEDAGQNNPPNDPFLDCQKNALDFTADHCGVKALAKAKGIDLFSFCMDSDYDVQAALMAVMGLTTEQQTWLLSSPTLFNDVVAFLDDKCWEEGVVEYTNSALYLMMFDTDVKWSRLVELFDILQQDPNALWCDQSGGSLKLNDYQDLLNFEPPGVCQTRLNDLNQMVIPGHGFWFQPIEDGNTPITNVDYFSVEINQLPDFNLDGIPDSPEETLETIRSNFNLLSIGSNQPLNPTCPTPLVTPPVLLSWSFDYFSPNDEIMWNSTQYLTSIFNIHASSDQVITDVLADEGAVMTTQQMSGCCWIFTSLKSPLNGLQPFSGDRQFGISLNSNGNYELYTKAIDRANINLMFKIAEIMGSPNCDAYDYYEIANLTWTSFCSKTASFINNYGGQAEVNNTLQEFVDYSIILEKLKSNNPVTVVPCN